MNKYSTGGDLIVSLDNTPCEEEGSDVRPHDVISYDNLFYSSDRDGIKRDLFEQLIKDSVFQLLRHRKVKKQHADIFMHSHGIDEYWPKKTASQISKMYRSVAMPATRVRTIRFKVAQKVLKLIIVDSGANK